MNDLQEPPKTVKEVGIHLFYLNQNVNKLTELVEKLQSGFVTKTEFDEYKEFAERERKGQQEQVNGIKLAAKWWVGVIVGVAAVVVAFVHK